MLGMAGVKFFRSRSRFCTSVATLVTLSTCRTSMQNKPCAMQSSRMVLPPPFEEFLDLADNRAISPEAFVSLTFGVVEDEFKEWAPCLNCMFGQGIPEGTRNTVMFAAAVGCKKEQPETWKQRLEEINQRFANPPLPASEIVTIQNQHDKKDYGFPCDQEPLRSFCNKTLCKTKKFGIGVTSMALDVTGLCV